MKNGTLDVIVQHNMPGFHAVGNEKTMQVFDHCGRGYPYGILYQKDREIAREIKTLQALKMIGEY